MAKSNSSFIMGESKKKNSTINKGRNILKT